jgi:predicted nucleic acid-binding protein
MVDQPPPLILDACCVINLLASGSLREIVKIQGVRVAIADVVLEHEVLRVPPEGEEEDGETATADRVLTLHPLVDEGRIEVMTIGSDPEMETFVSLALRLDDGEALSASLAIHRHGILATDDRKAIRVVTALAPELEIRRTSDLVRTWAELASPADAEVREVLRRVERDASFVPGATDPNVGWWRKRRG